MWYERPERKLLYAMAGMIVCLAGCAGKGDAAVNADMPAQTSADPTADIKTGVSYDTTDVSDSAAETSRVVTDFSDVAGEVVLPYEAENTVTAYAEENGLDPAAVFYPAGR